MDSLKFTKTVLQGLELPEAGKRKTLYDTEVKKLAVRVTATGARTFYVVKRAGGSMAWVKLGAFPDMTVEQARNAALDVLAEFAGGANPAEARRAYRGEPTLQEVFDDYLKHKRKKDGTPLAESTKKGYRLIAQGPLSKIMALKLSAVGHERIANLHRKVGAETPFMANRARALVSSLYGYALDRRMYSGENPAAGVRGYAEPSRDRFAGADELPRLFEAIAESGQRDFFLLALLTGARRANLCAMQWADVDLSRAVWRIAMTKNGTPQNVALSPEAVAVLKARKEGAGESPFVFPGEGKTGHLVEPKKAWRGILKRAGLENLRIHDLRRTLGSWQAMTGASMAIIGKSLNHKSQQATAIYARLELDPVRQSINTATSAMLEAAGMKQGADVLALPVKKNTAA